MFAVGVVVGACLAMLVGWPFIYDRGWRAYHHRFSFVLDRAREETKMLRSVLRAASNAEESETPRKAAPKRKPRRKP